MTAGFIHRFDISYDKLLDSHKISHNADLKLFSCSTQLIMELFMLINVGLILILDKKYLEKKIGQMMAGYRTSTIPEQNVYFYQPQVHFHYNVCHNDLHGCTQHKFFRVKL